MLNIVCCLRRYGIVVALWIAAVGLQAQDAPIASVTIQVDPATVVGRIAPDFIGFGYETSAVTESNYFSPNNKRLIRLYRNLSPHGLIRIGGCISDTTQYVPDGVPVAHSFHETSIINRENLVELGKFTRSTGWQVMWGLNLGSGTQAAAVQEALAVDSALGDRLHSFEVGNEVENLPNTKWDYGKYHALYVDYKGGIRAALPHAPFSGPDSIGRWEFITNFASAEAGDMKLLTQHYYCSEAHDPKATMERMLAHDEKFESRLRALQQLCQDQRLSYRINEVNSFSSGGKPGVSDTFGSALWALDYMFTLATHGCAGINLETDINQLFFISHYSPIVHDAAMVCSARPEYYGMLAFAMAGHGELVRTAVAGSGINLSAYATRGERGVLWLTIVNKDLVRDAVVVVTVPDTYTEAGAYWLRAPSVASKDQVTFAGAAVSASGRWKPKSPEKVAVKEGFAHLSVPHACAVVLRVRQ